MKDIDNVLFWTKLLIFHILKTRVSWMILYEFSILINFLAVEYSYFKYKIEDYKEAKK